MAYLYGATAAYGLGAGIWIDTLAKTSDPGTALIAPILLGAALPVTMFVWDYYGTLHKGVPATMATGILIGALEGFGVAGAASATATNAWGAGGWMSSIMLGSTIGGVGGYFFGEFLRPDPHSLGFISGGVGWGAVAGAFMGGGVTASHPTSVSSPEATGQGAAVGALVGSNLGLLGTGALSAFGYVPSWKAQKWMWVGALLGVALTSPIYIIYAAKDDQSEAKRGMIANGLGLVAGVTLASILTRELKDDDDAPKQAGFTPPFTLSVAPANGGAMFGAVGQW